MAYFSRQTLDFFRDLKQNNNRDWFNANKKIYETQVKEPFIRLAEDLMAEIRQIEPDFPVIPPKDCLFRINRDTRFAKDKSPYKDHAGLFICKRGKKAEYPGFYIHITDDEFFVGGGLWQLSPENIKKVRNAILHHTDEFLSILSDENFQKHYPEGLHRGQVNVILPAEFKTLESRVPVIAYKQFFVMQKFEPETVLWDGLVPHLFKAYQAGFPLFRFLGEAVG
jgi:uncharacterized protein (TIGR02453 family)